MGRVEKKLFKIADELTALASERRLVEAELEYHRHIDDDAQRDAVVSASNEDRLEATSTSADVRRFERRLRDIDDRREKLSVKRAALLEKLGDD